MMDDKMLSKALEKQLAKGPAARTSSAKKAKGDKRRLGSLSLHKRSASSNKSYGAGFPVVMPVGVSPVGGRAKSPIMARRSGSKSPHTPKRKGGMGGSGGEKEKEKGSGSGGSGHSRRLSLSAKFKSSVSKRKKSTPDADDFLDVSRLKLLRDQRVKVFGIELTTLLDRERDALGLLDRGRGGGALESDSRVPEKFKSGQSRHCIPFIVRQTVSHLRSTGGIKEAGLFRLCGKFSDMTSVQEAVDDGLALRDEDLEKLDTHTVGDLFKTFLRLLPHSIVPRVFFNHYMASTSAFEDIAERVQFLSALTLALPSDNWQLVRFLCGFFNEVAANSATNQMGAANLAIIFAPALFGDSNSNDSQVVVREMQLTAAVAQVLIEHYEEIFAGSAEPAAVMVAKESCNGENFSFFKGEQLVVSLRGAEEEESSVIPMALVGGKVVRNLPRSVVDEKCQPHEIMFATRSYDMPGTAESSPSCSRTVEWGADAPKPARAATVAVGAAAVAKSPASASASVLPTMPKRKFPADSPPVVRSGSCSPSGMPLPPRRVSDSSPNGPLSRHGIPLPPPRRVSDSSSALPLSPLASPSVSPSVSPSGSAPGSPKRPIPPLRQRTSTVAARSGTMPVPMRTRSRSFDGKTANKISRIATSPATYHRDV
mmetsp:Transcript_4516/g.15877  ORF Transcript_4516/g.15877 Transcript_4516/m.15877 type:complete len:653 (-) Transcript_4516:86-2044(-)